MPARKSRAAIVANTKPMTDITTLEHHHNALQISFNLLLMSLAKNQPDVVEDWLAALLHTLDTELSIPEEQRELLQIQFLNFANNMKEIKADS